MMDLAAVRELYESLAACHAAVREQLGRPLTLTEKTLFAHLTPGQELPQRGKGYVDLHPDRVAMQDATAQMALLQFALAGRDQVAVPSTVHCDHLIQARSGCDSDLAAANAVNAAAASGTETRITAIPARPPALARAYIVCGLIFPFPANEFDCIP